MQSHSYLSGLGDHSGELRAVGFLGVHRCHEHCRAPLRSEEFELLTDMWKTLGTINLHKMVYGCMYLYICLDACIYMCMYCLYVSSIYRDIHIYLSMYVCMYPHLLINLSNDVYLPSSPYNSFCPDLARLHLRKKLVNKRLFSNFFLEYK